MQDEQDAQLENKANQQADGDTANWKRIAAALMGGALFSKGLGFFREIFMAHVVGVAQLADSFRASITGFLLPLAFVQNESVPAVLVPMIREGEEQGDRPQRTAALTIVTAIVGISVMILAEIFGQYYIDLFVSGFSDEGKELTWMFFRILALSMPASVLLNSLVAAEITLGKTRIATLRASVINVGILTGLVLYSEFHFVSALAWAYTAVLNFLAFYGIMRLIREGHLRFDRQARAMVGSTARDFLKRLRPFLVLPLAEQANTWLERMLASRLAVGAIASIDYARTLTDSSMLLISHPIGWAVMAGTAHKKNQSGQAISISNMVLATIVPGSVFLFFFSEDVVRLIFYRGAFGDNGLAMTSSALSGVSMGLWAATLGWILLRFLNNTGRNKSTVVILMASFLANFVFNYFTQPLATSPEMGIFLLGGGETIRSIVLLLGSAVLLEYRMKIALAVLKSIIPAIAMGLISIVIIRFVDGYMSRLILGTLFCGVVALLALVLLSPEMVFSTFRAARQKAFGH